MRCATGQEQSLAEETFRRQRVSAVRVRSWAGLDWTLIMGERLGGNSIVVDVDVDSGWYLAEGERGTDAVTWEPSGFMQQGGRAKGSGSGKEEIVSCHTVVCGGQPGQAAAPAYVVHSPPRGPPSMQLASGFLPPLTPGVLAAGIHQRTGRRDIIPRANIESTAGRNSCAECRPAMDP